MLAVTNYIAAASKAIVVAFLRSIATHTHACGMPSWIRVGVIIPCLRSMVKAR